MQKQKNTSVEIDEFPEALNCDVFKEVWDRWHQHLKEKRKPATVNARVLQLGKLESMGLERAIAAINHSIEHNWQGIYEPATQVYGANSKAGNAKSITPVRGSSPVGGF